MKKIKKIGFLIGYSYTCCLIGIKMLNNNKLQLKNRCTYV